MQCILQYEPSGLGKGYTLTSCESNVCFPSDADYNLILNRHLIYTEIERLKITSKK